MDINIKLFSDLIDALGKVGSGLNALVNLPRIERDQYRLVLDDTNQLIHTALNMVILRLGDILRIPDEGAFLQKVSELKDYDEWLEAERKFRLCQSLRVAVSETKGLSVQFKGKISVQDFDELLKQMHLILETEGELASYIKRHLTALAFSAQHAQSGRQTAGDVRTVVEATRNTLKQERERLLQHEVELLNLV